MENFTITHFARIFPFLEEFSPQTAARRVVEAQPLPMTAEMATASLADVPKFYVEKITDL